LFYGFICNKPDIHDFHEFYYSNTSVNPARSTSQAIFAGDWALCQLWLFWVAPIAGAILAGLVYRMLSPETE
jgi:aquaporin Z